MASEYQPAEQEVRECLDRILASQEFLRSDRQSRFLRYIVDQGLLGVEPDEQDVGVAAFDRRPGYDFKADPIVRVETARLRDRLKTYYQAIGAADPLVIDIPQGALRPIFRGRPSAQPAGSGKWPRLLMGGLVALAIVVAGVVWYRQSEAEKASRARSASINLADRAERYARGLEKMPVAEARQIAEQAVAADPTYARAHTMSSRVYFKLVNERLVDEGRQELRDKALAAAIEAIRLDPKSDVARWTETLIYSEIDFNLQKAAATCRNHIRAIPDSSRLLSHCAGIQSLLGNRDLSVTWARSGVSVDPERIGAWYTLAMVQFRAGELKGLRETCDQIDRRSPSGSGGAMYRAYSYALEGNYIKALAILRVGETPQSLKDTTFLAMRGFMAAHANDKQLLQDTLEQLEKFRDRPDYQTERAIIALAQGNPDLLVEAIERNYLNGHIAYTHSLIRNPFLAAVLKEPRVKVIENKMRAYTE
jgi:tetratricopeptide (TPR) repeat protein